MNPTDEQSMTVTSSMSSSSCTVTTTEQTSLGVEEDNPNMKRRGSWRKFKEACKETVQGWVGGKPPSELETEAAFVPSAVFPTDEVTSATINVKTVLHNTNCYSGGKRPSAPDLPKIVVTCDERNQPSPGPPKPPERPSRQRGPAATAAAAAHAASHDAMDAQQQYMQQQQQDATAQQYMIQQQQEAANAAQQCMAQQQDAAAAAQQYMIQQQQDAAAQQYMIQQQQQLQQQQRSIPIPVVVKTPPSPDAHHSQVQQQQQQQQQKQQQQSSPPVPIPSAAVSAIQSDARSMHVMSSSSPATVNRPSVSPSSVPPQQQAQQQQGATPPQTDEEAKLKKRMAVMKIRQAILNINDDPSSAVGMVRRNSDTLADIPPSPTSQHGPSPLAMQQQQGQAGALPQGLRPQQLQQRRKSNSELLESGGNGNGGGGGGGVRRSQSMKKPKVKPMIWEHFMELPNTSTQGKCRVCMMNVSCKFNTGNFVRHLQLAHKDIYRQYQSKMENQWTKSVLERSLKQGNY